MRFFEIDPAVERIARDPRYFTYISACARGPVDVVLGDARLTLAHEAPGSYDALLLDAFTSDAIPTHLLTTAACFCCTSPTATWRSRRRSRPRRRRLAPRR
jgi:hypothetical protein